jgi:hypothetical protein
MEVSLISWKRNQKFKIKLMTEKEKYPPKKRLAIYNKMLKCLDKRKEHSDVLYLCFILDEDMGISFNPMSFVEDSTLPELTKSKPKKVFYAWFDRNEYVKRVKCVNKAIDLVRDLIAEQKI